MKAVIFAVRYGLPLLFLVAGIAMFFLAPTFSIGLDGLFMCIGAALSLLLITVLWRFGTEGDKERQAEEDARRFFSEHGHWPDEDGR